MPVHNGARFLVDAIESIRAQTYRDYEFLIIDDGSTDASPAILARQAIADTRIRVLTQENRGFAASLNRGFHESAGAWIARMDADDVARPHRLEAQVSFLNTHPGIALVGGAVEVIDAMGLPSQIIRLPETPDAIRVHMRNLGCALAHPTVMFRRQAVLDAGGLRPAYWPAEDYDLWLRMLETNDFANLPDVLVSYRRHEGSMSSHLTQQILSAFCARVVAGRRVQGMDDPTSGVDLVTPELVCSLGIDPHELDAEMFRGLCEATEREVDQGRASVAAEFLKLARPFADPNVLHETALKLNRRALNIPASHEEQSRQRRALEEASAEIHRKLFGTGVGVTAVKSIPARASGERLVSSNVLRDILKQNRYDTDKMDETLRQYDRCFAHLRNRSISVLEVGVNRGGSLHLWRDYFERATLVGLDIAPPRDFFDPSGRCSVFQCDQGDPSALRRIANETAPGGFHIIIDDASHIASLTAITFKTLFYEHLQPGGFYAIEDWGTGYWESWPDGAQPSPPVELSFPSSGNRFPSHDMGMVGLLKQLIDESALSDIFHPRFGVPRTRSSWIRSMHICVGLLIIEKAWE